MTFKNVIISFALTLSLLGCKSAPIIPRVNESGGSAIGIDVRINIGFASYPAEVVYFVNTCKVGEVCEEKFYVSNYAKDGRVYLLNMPAGSYTAIGASFSYSSLGGATDTFIAYFPMKLIAQTQATLDKGKFVYAGSYVVNTSVGLCAGEADEKQMRYAEKIEPGSAKCGWLRPALEKAADDPVIFVGGSAVPLGGHGHIYHYTGAIKSSIRDAVHENEFIKKAQDDLAGGGWRVEMMR